VLCHVDLQSVWQIVQILNERCNGAVHFAALRDATFEKRESVKHNRSVRNLRAFLQYPPVKIIKVKIKAWIIAVEFKGP
jgi:hypothetical protein